MNINPEFQRQLYLECSQARLIGVPSVLGILFSFCYFLDDYRLGAITAKTALSLFMLITLLWGAKQSMDSISEEYRERTWDTQRLSALGPWEMTWGKLFGGNVMVWYAGLICLLVYSLSTEQPNTLPRLLFYGLSIALLVQSGGLLLGLLAVQRGQTKSSSIVVLAIIIFLTISPWLMTISGLSGTGMDILAQSGIAWYHMLIDSRFFYPMSLLLALFWCGLGNYRLMTQELGMRTLPWAWLGFCLFLTVYLGGFIPSTSFSLALAAFVICGILTYIGLVVERNEAMRIKRLVTYFAQGHWRRGGEEMPIWWLSFALTIPAALALSWSDNAFMLNFSHILHFYPLAMVLILLRDCAIYLYFFYGKNPQRAIGMSLLVWVLLYGIIPGIFKLIGQNALVALSFPLWADSAAGALVCAFIQTGFVLYLLYGRWKSST